MSGCVSAIIHGSARNPVWQIRAPSALRVGMSTTASVDHATVDSSASLSGR